MTPPRTRPRKARKWTLCVEDGQWEPIYFPLAIGRVWGDKGKYPGRRGLHFRAPHEHVDVIEVLPPRKRPGRKKT